MGIMRWMAVVLAAVCCVATAAPKQPETIDVWLRAGIDVDENGRVVALDWQRQSKAHALIARRLAPVVREWEFEPATADGKPAATRTGLLVHVLVDKHDDGSVMLRLADARTGPMASSLVPPAYPIGAASRDISAFVMVTVEVGADGSPIIRDMTYESSRGGEGYRKAFILSTREAVERWAFLPEIVAGRAMREPVSIPVNYCMEPSKWCERMSERDAERDTANKLPDGLHMADSSAVALKTRIREQVI